MNILLKYHIRKEDEKYSLDEKCWTITSPHKIAKSDLPSNRQVQFTLKSSVQFTPPSNHQVRFGHMGLFI